LLALRAGLTRKARIVRVVAKNAMGETVFKETNQGEFHVPHLGKKIRMLLDQGGWANYQGIVSIERQPDASGMERRTQRQ